MMTPSDLMAHMDGTFQQCLRIAAAKNKDYAGDTDALANFRKVEDFGVCPMETGILVRLTDKFSRLVNLASKPAAVTDESIEDTMLDMINYLAIWRSARAARKEDAR